MFSEKEFSHAGLSTRPCGILTRSGTRGLLPFWKSRLHSNLLVLLQSDYTRVTPCVYRAGRHSSLPCQRFVFITNSLGRGAGMGIQEIAVRRGSRIQGLLLYHFVPPLASLPNSDLCLPWTQIKCLPLRIPRIFGCLEARMTIQSPSFASPKRVSERVGNPCPHRLAQMAFASM